MPTFPQRKRYYRYMPYKRSYGKPKVSRKRTRAQPYVGLRAKRFQRAVKSIIAAKQYRKQHVISGNVLNSVATQSLYHDNLYGILLKQPTIPAGLFDIGETAASTSTSDSRLGESIYTTGILFRAMFSIPADRRNLRMRIWMVEYNSIQGDPFTYSQFFKQSSGNSMLDHIDNDRFKPKLLFNGCLPPQDRQQETTDSTLYVTKYIPFKRKLQYLNGGSTHTVTRGMKENLAFVITLYDTISTSSTTDVISTSNEFTVTLYYKDQL